MNAELDPHEQTNPGHRNWFMIFVLLIAGAAGVGAFFATGRMQAPPPPPQDNSPHRFDAKSHRFGQGPGARGGPGGGSGEGRGEEDVRGLDEMHLRRFLNLDDEQVQKVRAADPEFRPDMVATFKSMHEARNRLVEVLQNEDSTDEQILTRLDEVLALNARMERRIVDHLLRIRPHLDPDQSRRLMRLCAMHIRSAAMGRGGRGGPGGPGGPGPGGRERFRDFEPDRPPSDQPAP